jgi:murein L,D-transpeptidase YcbB/YkuD
MIDLNLRRMMTFPLHRAQTRLVLNIAGAELAVLDAGRQIAGLRAVVGRPDWPTPELHSAIVEIDFNPVWTVPPRIVQLELLPRLRRDPGYLQRNQIRVAINPNTGVRVYRQAPGPLNPLGAVRFNFPNADSVYLHDTPNKELFDRAVRTFSHGCVRVERALDLAAYLLAGQPGWTRDRIDAVVASGESQTVRLSTPVPIDLVYWTAWVDSNGVLQFRDDPYARDFGSEHQRATAAPEACTIASGR